MKYNYVNDECGNFDKQSKFYIPITSSVWHKDYIIISLPHYGDPYYGDPFGRLSIIADDFVMKPNFKIVDINSIMVDIL